MPRGRVQHLSAWNVAAYSRPLSGCTHIGLCRRCAAMPAAAAHAQDPGTHLQDLGAEGIDALGQAQHLTMQRLQVPCLHLPHVTIDLFLFGLVFLVFCTFFVFCVDVAAKICHSGLK